MEIRSIVHPTDFSDLSGVAFAHALRIALATRSKLHLLHISQQGTGGALAFPHARRLLAQWGLSDAEDPPWAIAEKLGIEVHNSSIKWQEPVPAILGFLREHDCDLIVLATHGRDGLAHWLKGSVSETVSRRSSIPTLFVAPGTRGFVSQVNGDLRLRRALVPVDFSPEPGKAIEAVQRIGRLLAGADIDVDLIHVGRSAPPVHVEASSSPVLPDVILRHGNVVQSIVDAAIELEADLIGMPTAGHNGVLDALRGSTTERVIRHAPCPILTIPAA
jgi:nucleotide-binding universal stress UspA family protein